VSLLPTHHLPHPPTPQTLFITGAVLYAKSLEGHGTGMMIIGGLMLLPGTYGTIKAVRFVSRRYGFEERLFGFNPDPDDDY